MEITKNYIQSIVNTLPIGIYLKRNATVTLEEYMSMSNIDLLKLEIHLSLKQLINDIKNLSNDETNDFEIENIVRGCLYHEVSHAILTPNQNHLYVTATVNIFEDERIEQICKNIYKDVDFKKRLQIRFRTIPTANTAEQLYFNIVRLNNGPTQFIERKKELIKKYAHINPASQQEEINEYKDEIYKFFNDVKQYFLDEKQKEIEEQRKRDEELQKQARQWEEPEEDEEDEEDEDDIEENEDNEDNEESSEDDNESNEPEINLNIDEDTNSFEEPNEENEVEESDDEDEEADIFQGFDEENDEEDDEEDEKEDDEDEELIEYPEKFFEQACNLLDKYSIKTLVGTLQSIITSHRAVNKSNASAINSYSGVFDPRQVIRNDYKYFLQKGRQGNIKKFAKTKLNLFIDNSGSFHRNVPFVNRLLEALEIFEKTNDNFEFDVIRCGCGQEICDKNNRRIQGNDGTFLKPTIFEQFKKVQSKDANNYNIVLFDGDAFCSCYGYKDDYYKDFTAFNTTNTFIISDRTNEKYISIYAPKAKSIFSDDYVNLLFNNTMTALNTLLR